MCKSGKLLNQNLPFLFFLFVCFFLLDLVFYTFSRAFQYSVFLYYPVSIYYYVVTFFSLTMFLTFLTKSLIYIIIKISFCNFYFFVWSNYRQARQLYILQNNLKSCSDKNLLPERYIRTN